MTDTFSMGEGMVLDAETVDLVIAGMPGEGRFNELSEFFKILGDQTRLKILYALTISEMCVMDIAAALNMERTAISHQLRTLKSARLVRARRDGKSIYYSFDDEHVSGIFELSLEHLSHKSRWEEEA